MTDTGEPPQGQRMYCGPPPGGYHLSGAPAAVSYNGVGDPQAVYRQPGPPDFQPGQFYPAPPRSAGIYGPKTAGMVGRPGWVQTRYAAAPPTSTLNQLLHGPSTDGWVPEYGQAPRSMVDQAGCGGNQEGWVHQQQQPPHLVSATGPSSYTNRQQPTTQNIQVDLLNSYAYILA